MFICQYCGAAYTKFQSPCDSCGAVLEPTRRKKSLHDEANSFEEKLRQICAVHEDAREFLPGNVLSVKKLRNAKKNFTVFPEEQVIILFCDTHPFRKGKRGFIICEDGLYWQNTWAAETNRNYLPWGEFAKRELNLKHFHLHLERGDMIGLSGLGSDEKRDKAFRLLTEIKESLTK